MQYWFVTGSSRGLGKAITEQLLSVEGNVVYGYARTKHTAESKNFHSVITDLSDIQELSTFEFPHLENPELIVLINNAATLGDMHYLGNLDTATIISGHILNTIAPHVLINKFIKQYKSLAAPKVIGNITSGAANTPYDGWSIYGSDKAALDMITRIANSEAELQNQNIKIFGIAPGVMATDMQKQIRNADPDNFSRKKKFDDLHAENKLISPESAASRIIEYVKNYDTVTDTIFRL